MSKKKASKKKATSKAVTTVKDQLPAGIDFQGDVGGGMEGTDKDSFAIPFLSVIQKMSPEVDEADPKFIESARPGMFSNSVTTELFDGKKGVIFIPCAFHRRFLRWAPRDSGGGFKGDLSPEEATELEMNGTVVQETGRLYFVDEDGNFHEKKSEFLADTRNHFGLLLNEETGQGEAVLLSISSTQIKKSKQMMTLLNNVKINGVTPPTWVNRVKLTTVPESNDKGSWSGLKIELDGFIGSQDLYDAGKSLHDIIATGKVSVNYEATEEKTEDGKF